LQTDVIRSVVCVSVCLAYGYVVQKTDKPIVMPFEVLAPVGPRNYVLDGGMIGRN